MSESLTTNFFPAEYVLQQRYLHLVLGTSYSWRAIASIPIHVLGAPANQVPFDHRVFFIILKGSAFWLWNYLWGVPTLETIRYCTVYAISSSLVLIFSPDRGLFSFLTRRVLKQNCTTLLVNHRNAPVLFCNSLLVLAFTYTLPFPFSFFNSFSTHVGCPMPEGVMTLYVIPRRVFLSVPIY